MTAAWVSADEVAEQSYIDKAKQLGKENGVARAAWFFDGNTTHDTYEYILAGIEAGDPEVLDQFPHSPLSGEWAGDPTPNGLLFEMGISERGVESHVIDEISTAFEQGFDDGVVEEIERVARKQVNIESAIASEPKGS